EESGRPQRLEDDVGRGGDRRVQHAVAVGRHHREAGEGGGRRPLDDRRGRREPLKARHGRGPCLRLQDRRERRQCRRGIGRRGIGRTCVGALLDRQQGLVVRGFVGEVGAEVGQQVPQGLVCVLGGEDGGGARRARGGGPVGGEADRARAEGPVAARVGGLGE